jgi:hypothetical protein
MSGYGSFDGTSPDMNPIDDTISTDQGSGQDRLQLTMIDDAMFRFAVDVPPLEAGSSSDSGADVTSGGGDDSADSPPAEGDDGSVGEGSGSAGGSGGAVMDRGCACGSTASSSPGLLVLALALRRRARSRSRDRAGRVA